MGSEAGTSENGKSAAKVWENVEKSNPAKTAMDVRFKNWPMENVSCYALVRQRGKYTAFERIIQRKTAPSEGAVSDYFAL